MPAAQDHSQRQARRPTADDDNGVVFYAHYFNRFCRFNRFNPLPSPKRGETRTRPRLRREYRVQSAPLTEARGGPCCSTSIRFNPLPSPKQGETGHVGAAGPGQGVSIRSPHRSKGRRRRAADHARANGEFQSAPLTEARGDPKHPAARAGRSGFNPLPSPKQGETDPRHLPVGGLNVSIRSPHRSKGRPISGPRWKNRRLCFNPLPSPKQGETRHPAAIRPPRRSFNPLPSPKQGETSNRKLKASFASVSIRSPHRSKGRQGTWRSARPCRHGFNPLPSPKQGETFSCSHNGRRCFGFNPLPSPKQGETQQRRRHCVDGVVSIRSPHRSKGRHRLASYQGLHEQVSIRSPHRSKGRPIATGGGWIQKSVSIRSPHRSKGRPKRCTCYPIGPKFQSAPLTEARGD